MSRIGPGIRNPTNPYNSGMRRNPITAPNNRRMRSRTNELGYNPLPNQYSDDRGDASDGNYNMYGKDANYAYTSHQIFHDDDEVSLNTQDKIYADAVCDSYKYINNRTVKQFDTLYHYVSLQFINACEPRNHEIMYYMDDLANCTQEVGYESAKLIKSGYLRIHQDAFPEFMYSDELFINIKETTNNVASGCKTKLHEYNFRLIQDATLSNNNWIVYRPDNDCFNLGTWQNLNTITLTILNNTGPILFEYPEIIPDSIVVGTNITTFTGTHNLNDGDEIIFPCRTGYYPVTVIDDETFTVPIEISTKKYIVSKLNFSYNLMFNNIKYDRLDTKC